MSAADSEVINKLDSIVTTNLTSLEPIGPAKGIEKYLRHKETEVRPQTIKEYKRKLSHFKDFCERKSIENLNQLNGRLVDDFRQYRRTETGSQEGPLSTKTMNDDMYLLQDFLSYLGSIEGVPADLSSKVEVPDLGSGDGVRDISIDSKRVERILEYLDKYEYATRPHVVWLFHAHTGRRPSGMFAIDVSDLYLDADRPYIEIRHREGETELKNGEDGEAEVFLSDYVAEVFSDYLESNRTDVATSNDRRPFLTSSQGRLSKSTMRKYVYKYSRPCVLTNECPHDRDIETCEAAQSVDAASKCPTSRPPYALRHGYITSKRGDGVPDRFISGRCDVSPAVLDKHYDERDETEKRQLRQEVFNEIRDDAEADNGGYL